MKLNLGDTVLLHVYFAPNLDGVEVGVVKGQEVHNNKVFYTIVGKRELFRADQIILKFTSDQLQRYELIRSGRKPQRPGFNV